MVLKKVFCNSENVEQGKAVPKEKTGQYEQNKS